MAPDQRNPLFNTTFILNRISPLYTGSNTPLTNASLESYARTFRDILAGEVLRGVRVGLGSDADLLARVGALETVTWMLLEGLEQQKTEGIVVTVTYEKATYIAILLRPREQYEEELTESMDGFQHFPLLLTRMPGSLRESLTDFLSTTFDTRVSRVHMGKKYLMNTLEDYMTQCSSGEGSETSRNLTSLLKDVQVVIGFEGVGELTNVDILIDKADIPHMLGMGTRLGLETTMSPFSTALRTYISKNLALDIAHEKVRITKVACGAFVLGSEGKIKLTEPVSGNALWNKATEKLIYGLVELANTM